MDSLKTKKEQLKNCKLDLTRIKKSIYQALIDANKDKLDTIAFDIRTSQNNFKEGPTITYKEYLEEMRKNAKSSSILDIKTNDIVPIILPNIVEARTLIYGHNILGAISYPLSLMAPVNQIDAFLSSEKIKNIFILNDFYEKYKKALQHTTLENIICLGDPKNLPKGKKIIPWSEYQKLCMQQTQELTPYYKENETTILIGTSGTTGVSKASCITNENLNASAISYIDGNVFPGNFMDALIPSITYGMIMMHLQGMDNKTVYLIPELLTDKTAKALSIIKPDVFAGGPVHQYNIVESKEFKKGKMPPRKIYLSGGASLDKTAEKTLNGVEEGYKENGIVNENIIVRQGYALTETTGLASIAKRGYYKLGSIGIPMLYTEIAIFQPNTEIKLGPNQKGEICISGPNIIKGYYKNQEETNIAFKIHKDGKRWLHTQDIGYFDEEGYLFHVDRMKDIFMRFGFNVHPKKIAEFINKLPYVQNCTVIGVPHPIEQMVPVAFIQLRPNTNINLIDLDTIIKQECYHNLEETSVPLDILFVDMIPINLGGKVDKKALLAASEIDYYSPEKQIKRTMKLNK